MRLEPLHILMRIPTTTELLGYHVDVIDEHNRMIRTHGATVVGRFGVRPSMSSVRKIQNQLEKRTETTLILVTRAKQEFSFWVASVSSVYAAEGSLRLPAAPPKYYKDFGRSPTRWIGIDSELKTTTASEVRLASNGRLAIDVLSECRTSFMFVTRSNGTTE